MQQIKKIAICRIDGHSSDEGVATTSVAAQCGSGWRRGRRLLGVSHVPILSWNVKADPLWRTVDDQNLPMPWMSWSHDNRERNWQGLLFWLADVQASFQENHGVL